MAGFSPMYNNTYGNLYGSQPLSNPMVGYQERMAQLQQQYNMAPTQPMVQQYVQPMNGLLGKVVDSLEVVKATDVPMDGNCYYFPKADGTEIYAKRWLSNGTTEVVTYKPSMEVVPAQESVEQKTLHGDILEKLDGIEERIGKIEKSLGNRSTQVRSKKEEE